MKVPKQNALQGVCNRVAGNMSAGAILYRANYWTPKASIDVFDDGRLWIAKRADVWCQETGLSTDQYRRAITGLRRSGLIETTQDYFGRYRITHLRLTDRAIDLIRSGVIAASTGGVSFKQRRDNPTSAPLPGRNAQLSDGPERAAQMRKSAHLCEKREENEDRNKEGESGSRGDTAFEPEGSKQGFRERRGSIQEAWKNEVGTRLGRHVSLTLANRRQLQQFADRCPEGTAIAVMTEAVSVWGRFTSTAKSEAGAFNVPEMPQVEFLLKFADVAVNRWQRNREEEERLLVREKRAGAARAKHEEITKQQLDEQQRHIEEEEQLRLALETITLTDEEEDERRMGGWEPDGMYAPAPPSVVTHDDIPWSKVPEKLRATPQENAHRALFLRHVIAARRGLA